MRGKQPAARGRGGGGLRSALGLGGRKESGQGNGCTISKASTALGSCRLYSSDKAMFVAHPMLVGSSLSASWNSSAAFDDCPDASAKNALCWSPHAPAGGPHVVAHQLPPARSEFSDRP